MKCPLFTLLALISPSMNMIRFIIINESSYVVYDSTILLNSIFSPSGNIKACSYPTSSATAIFAISSEDTVPRCSFLLKFCGVCPIRLQSSARLIFILSHNSLIISDVVISHLHQHSTIINPMIDKHKLPSLKLTAY